MQRSRFVFLMLIAGCLSTKNAFSQLPAGFDRYVDTVLKTFEVPGMSISVVKDGKVILAKGYGIKRLGEAGRVNEHTLFPIASNTKAFTVMALAILVDEGKLNWDDRVITHLPWFKMSDPWITSEITIRDLLVHHSGIPAFAGDVLLFPPSTYSRRQILEKVKDIPIVHSFRTTYAYDNILYVTAGEVITQVSHMDWQDFVQQRILNKAGMTESLARFAALKNVANRATGHLRLQKKVVAMDEYIAQDIGDAGDPAGGVTSNAVDMAKWLLTQLDSGKAPNQVRLLRSSITNDFWKIVTPIPIGKVPASLKPVQADFYGYALGVRASNYGKYKVISHGGKLDGFVSHVLLIPSLHLGITVLTNQESTGAYYSVIYHLLDYYMQNPLFDWIGGYKQQLDILQADWQKEWNKAVVTPDPKAPKPTDIEKYSGTYRDDFYGDISISKEGAGLKLQFVQTAQLAGSVTPFQYETFKVTFYNPALKADGYLSFTLAPDGSPASCQLKVIDPSSDIGFDGLIFKKIKSK